MDGNGGHEKKSWMMGLVLIAVGVVFLLQNNVWGFRFDNWWALFILIPAAGSLGSAWNLYHKNNGQITQAVMGPLLGGLFFTCVAGVFLFNLDWGKVWPIFLILAGLGALGRSMIGQREETAEENKTQQVQ